MEVVLTVLVYLFIIGCVLLLPFLLYISVFVFSANIPSLAIINQVTYAAEGCVEVRTWYFPFGSCETGVNFDGLYSIN